MITALLFPGQGSHAAGMESPWRHAGVIQRGIDLLGYDPFARLAEGIPFQQPALFLCGLAALEAEGGTRAQEPAAAAGHSLGEYAALTAAGVLGFEDALRLVALRGDALARAAEATPGGMLAVLGAANGHELALRHGLALAHDNAPRQLVLSGPLHAIEAAQANAAARRLPVRRLAVPGAFHSPLMAPAAEELAAALGQVEVRPPRFAVYSGGTAAAFEDVRAELAANMLRTVRWRETLLALRARGVERLVTLGPHGVLHRLAKRTMAAAA